MNIYAPKTITERIERQFKPTRLAVKECNGVKYLCKSTKQDFETYKGSGVRWKRIVKKHGKQNVKTLWVSDWFYCPYHIQEFALMFGEYNQIVESEEWANLIPENGLDGGFQTPSAIKKMMDTKTKNNTRNSNPEISSKMIKTKIKNGTLNSNTEESILKGLDTKRKNGTLAHTSDRKQSIKRGRKNGKRPGPQSTEHSLNISKSLTGHKKTNVMVSRLTDRKVMTLCAFTKWCNQSYFRPTKIGPYKKQVCRLSDRKEMTIGKFLQYLERVV